MEKDIFLTYLVWRVEDGDFRADVSLQVGGKMLVGDMISEREFFEGVASTIPTEQEDQHEFILGMPATFDESAQDEAEERRDAFFMREASKRDFIHLAKVRVFEAGEYHEFPRTFWRGKVSAVDAVSMGSPLHALG